MNRSNAITWAICIALIFAGAAAIITVPRVVGSILGEGGLLEFGASAPDLSANRVDLPYPNFLPKTQLMQDELTFCQEAGTTWQQGFVLINSDCQVRFSIPDILLVLGLTGLLLGAIIGAGLPLVIIVPLLAKLVKGTKESDEYAQGVKAMEDDRKTFVKAMKEEKPPYPMPDHNRPGWEAIAATICTMTFLGFTGAAYAVSFTDSHGVWNWGYLFAAVGLLLSLLFFNRNRMATLSSEATTSVDWGRIWIVLTGLVIMGIGMGLMFFVRSSG